MTKCGRKMAAKGVSMRNIEPIPHSKFEEILENSTTSVKRPQTNIRKVGENMCTVTINKETINAFENKRWWGNANTSHGYGHPDIIGLPGGSDCNPVRFDTVVETANNNRIVHAGVDNSELFEDELDDDDDALLAMACGGYEPARDAFDDYVDNMVEDLEHAKSETEIDDFYNVSFDELEDSVRELESVEDPTNSDPEIGDLFNESFDEMEVPEVESVEDPFNESFDISALDDENNALIQASIIIPADDERNANFKRKSDADFDKYSKKPKQ